MLRMGEPVPALQAAMADSWVLLYLAMGSDFSAAPSTATWTLKLLAHV